ncbi:Vegetative incompatibility protein HET-E-1 [Cladobotryum mycophilum]|uniref:Vegetative incompatibility protein HET-E-1 n=1 Tax=Cladobotryum mycophilum TaxID=491253 RepID=A0ABR0SBB8_9HYPO
MRLLNVQTLEVEEFYESNTPPYAILSHTWGSEEVSLQDIQGRRADHLKGYQKILGCCEQAKRDGFEFVWIDTCCIDKTSSAELAEAINSMFNWYRKSIACYAYLEDLDSAAFSKNPEVLHDSRWFTRGWTLQELIAPSIVTFFDSKWEDIGSKDSWVELISEVTGIDQDLFLKGKLSQYSVAQRMSWAAKRHTTRPEDEAYCLLGLFGVTMPLVYGEGKMAFIRLQEEIMKRSDDQSIFTWKVVDGTASGLLAPSPACFAESRAILKANDRIHDLPFFTTNKGIQITLPILKSDGRSHPPSFEPMSSGGSGPKITVTLPDAYTIAILNCETHSDKKIGLVIDKGEGSEQFHRTESDMGPLCLDAEDCEKNAIVQTILMRSHEPLNDLSLWNRLRPNFFIIQGLPKPETGYKLTQTFGSVKIRKTGILFGHLSEGMRGGAIFTKKEQSFGVFLAEMWNQSSWELASGVKAEVESKALAFMTKPERLMTSRPFWKLPLVNKDRISAVSLKTCRRRHGYLGILKIESRTSINLPQGTPPITEGLVAMLAEQWKDDSPGIGWKGSGKYSDTLSTEPRIHHAEA